MNRLSIERRAQILAMLTEGNSMRATARMAGCAFNTVSKLLLDVGGVCTEFQDRCRSQTTRVPPEGHAESIK